MDPNLPNYRIIQSMLESNTENRQIFPIQDADSVIKQFPPLPNNWVRLTHFTSQRIAEQFTNGQNFSYESQGIIGQTTDPFTNSPESLALLQSLIETGKMGNFTRTEFGNCIVLIDMDGRENKKRNGFYVEYQDVPNQNIVGYIQIVTDERGERKYIFHSNPKFRPSVTEMQPITRNSRLVTRDSVSTFRSADEAAKLSDSGEDVW